MAVDRRRRFKRFDQADSDWSLVQIRRIGVRLEFEECLLVNLSYGGMCLQTPSKMGKGEENYFLLDIRSPLNDLAFVKVRVEWVTPTGLRQNQVGVSFLESSKGWLGPTEELSANNSAIEG